MTQLIPFESAQLPAYLTNATGAMALNAQAEEFASVRFPVISIKSNRFHLKKDGERSIILRPKTNATDPDEPASYLDLVVLNLQKAKSYYAEGYVEGAAEKPDCSSEDGKVPSLQSTNKQCDSCALCPHNAWGSGKNDKGEATKGKACSDVLRLAVASSADFHAPMLLNVPPASLKNFAELSKTVSKKNIPLNAVVVRVSFDATSNGVLVFQPVAMLDQAAFTESLGMMNDDLVLSITGKKVAYVPTQPAIAATQPVAQAAAPAVDPDVEAKKAKADAKAKKVAAAKAAAEAAAKAAAEAEDDDDEDEAAPAVPAKTVVATSDSFDAELAKLIG